MKFFATSLTTAVLVAQALAASQTCVVGTLGGECVTTTTCSSNGGKSTSGHCPGAANSKPSLLVIQGWLITYPQFNAARTQRCRKASVCQRLSALVHPLPDTALAPLPSKHAKDSRLT
jgi:hypothetical protein